MREFLPLSDTERKVLESCQAGEPAKISTSRPTTASNGNSIRGAFLRFLLLGGDEESPIHENGIIVVGAYITGVIDLYSCKIDRPMMYRDCTFESPIILVSAKTSSIQFSSSRLNGITADGCYIKGEMVLESSRCVGVIRLISAEIHGSLNFLASRLYNSAGDVLICDRMEVSGSLAFTGSFRSLGTVRLRGATVGGVLNCMGGIFLGNRRSAILADGIKVGGGIYLTDGFAALGEVRLLGCKCGGDLGFENSIIRNKGGIALNARSANIGVGLIFRDVKQIVGKVKLDSVKANDLIDDEESIDKVEEFVLDGFYYNRISGNRSPTDARRRIKWLNKQSPVAYHVVFWPQPWEHLAKILRDMGHVEDARLVAMEMQRELRRKGIIGNRQRTANLSRWPAFWNALWVYFVNGFERLLHRVYGALAGYGYRPLRTFMLMLLFWIAAAGAYTAAEQRGLFVPSTVSLLTQANLSACGPAQEGLIRWTRCPRLPRDYTTFDPLMYSLDVILPLVDLKQEGDWEPLVRRGPGWRMWDGLLIRGIMWAEILFGWIGSLLIVAALGRLVQKD